MSWLDNPGAVAAANRLAALGLAVRSSYAGNTVMTAAEVAEIETLLGRTYANVPEDSIERRGGITYASFLRRRFYREELWKEMYLQARRVAEAGCSMYQFMEWRGELSRNEVKDLFNAAPPTPESVLHNSEIDVLLRTVKTQIAQHEAKGETDIAAKLRRSSKSFLRVWLDSTVPEVMPEDAGPSYYPKPDEWVELKRRYWAQARKRLQKQIRDL